MLKELLLDGLKSAFYGTAGAVKYGGIGMSKLAGKAADHLYGKRLPGASSTSPRFGGMARKTRGKIYGAAGYLGLGIAGNIALERERTYQTQVRGVERTKAMYGDEDPYSTVKSAVSIFSAANIGLSMLNSDVGNFAFGTLKRFALGRSPYDTKFTQMRVAAREAKNSFNKINKGKGKFKGSARVPDPTPTNPNNTKVIQTERPWPNDYGIRTTESMSGSLPFIKLKTNTGGQLPDFANMSADQIAKYKRDRAYLRKDTVINIAGLKTFNRISSVVAPTAAAGLAGIPAGLVYAGLTYPVATAAAYGAVGTGLGAYAMRNSGIGKWLKKTAKSYPEATGFFIAGATAGAVIGASAPVSPAGEGNIISAEYANKNTTRRLNYSTAGLVQALHSNRRSIDKAEY